MGRGATKAAGNVWYEARMEAAKWNDKLLSRAGAAEALNMSEDAVKDAELGLNKCMPVALIPTIQTLPTRTMMVEREVETSITREDRAKLVVAPSHTS